MPRTDEQTLALMDQIANALPDPARPAPAKPTARAKKAAGGGSRTPKIAAAAPPDVPPGSKEEFLKALLMIEVAMSGPTLASLTSPGPSPLAAMSAAELAAKFPDLCPYYTKVRPYLDTALEGVEWLPYGTTITKVVRLLMKMADIACPQK